MRSDLEFFIACIILGLEDLQKNSIIHRDIKPENLVLDSRGYVRITDLGIARTYKPNNSCDTSGTPGYMCKVALIQLRKSFAE
jgi:serine/threonine protein kinase